MYLWFRLHKTFLLLGQLVFDFFVLVHIHRLESREKKKDEKMGKQVGLHH